MSCDSGGLQANGCDSGDALARVVPTMESRLWESKGGAVGSCDLGEQRQEQNGTFGFVFLFSGFSLRKVTRTTSWFP